VDLANARILVTGGGRRLGAAIALDLAGNGARVAITHHSAPPIEAIGAAGIHAVRANLADPAAARAAVEEAAQVLGGLDGVVHAASAGFRPTPLDEITPEHFHKQYNLNVLGLLLATQEAVRHFGASGSVVNIGSVAGDVAPPLTAAYSGTKAAVDAITKALAKELGPKGIRVNTVNPGMVETEGTHSLGITESEWRKQVEAQTPLGRIGKPDDIAPAVAFLASDDAKWITGETLYISGGNR